MRPRGPGSRHEPNLHPPVARPKSALLRLLLLGIAGLIPARLPAEPLEFDVPAQPADGALLTFSKQARIELLFSFDALRGARSAGVIGRFEPEEALMRLLQGTGFGARRNSSGKFIVTPIAEPMGSIKGRLVTQDGAAIRGIRVAIIEARQETETDGSGEFDFPAVPPGTYLLAAAGPGLQPLQITHARVDANRVLTLETQVMRPAGETNRLAPFIVEGKSWPSQFSDRDQPSQAPRTAAGNIDLPRSEEDALPFRVYDRDQIARSGVVNLDDFLQRELLDSDATTRPPDQSPGTDLNASHGAGAVAGSFVTGSTNLNFRGYGNDATVVLVNGRRLPENVIAGYPTQPPDVNLIPLNLVERIEVLPLSAAALYTGNPVGGVINIVLRPDVNTTEVTATYTNGLGRVDAPQSSVSLLHGESLLHGALRVRFDATFTETTPPTEAELGYIQANLRANPGLNSPPLYRATPNVTSASLSPLFGPGTPDATSVAPGADGTGGLAAFAGRQGVASVGLFSSPEGLVNSPNSANYPYGRRQQGASYFGSATYDVLPRLQIGLDALYSHTVIHQGLDMYTGNLTLPAGSPFNPFGQDVNVTLNETAPQLGADYDESRLDSVTAVLGLLLKLPADWEVSLDTQYGISLTRYRGLAGVDPTRWQQLVDEGIYNPLRDTEVHGPPQQFYDQALVYYGAPGRFVTPGDYDAVDTALRLTNQSLTLPTGSGVVIVGGDFERNHLDTYNDVLEYGDGTQQADPGEWAGRTLEQLSGFGELQAPLLPSRWLPRWLQHVETDVSARYTAANLAQDTSVAPTYGLRFDFTGGFSLRGSIATANRFPTPVLSEFVPAPAVNGASGTGVVSTTPIIDPLRQNEQYGVSASDEVNPDLRPEAAVTRTVGIAYQGGRTHKIRVTLDYVDTRTSGELADLSAQDVVDLESELPGRVTRAPLAPGDPNSVGMITSVLTGEFNLAWRHSQNWNTSFDYAWTDCLGGRLDLYTRWVYFQRYDLELLPFSPPIDELHHPAAPNPDLIKNRVNFGAGWSRNGFGFGVDGHYYGSRIIPADEQQAQGSDRIDSFAQYDAYLQCDLARWLPWKSSHYGLRGQLRVNNLFNASPPRYEDDPSGAGVQEYGDWRGRVYSLSLTATF